MNVKKIAVVAVYDGENRLTGIAANDEKTHKTILYDLSESEVGFDGVAEFLERVAKNGGNGSITNGAGGSLGLGRAG